MKVKKYFNRDFLIALRRRASETQQVLADSLGLDVSTIRSWEGGGKSPEQKNLQALAEHYQVDWSLFRSRAEQVAWQNYQIGIMLAQTDHDQASRDAINLNALPQWNAPEIEPGDAQKEDDDLLAEGDVPNV